MSPQGSHARWNESGKRAPRLGLLWPVKIGGTWYDSTDPLSEGGVEAYGAYRYWGDVLTLVEVPLEEVVHALRAEVLGVKELLYAPDVLLHYAPGAPHRGLAHSRASEARYSGEARQVRTAASGVLRDQHYRLNPVRSLDERTTLLEGPGVNRLIHSEAIESWSAGNAVITPGFLDPAGGTNARRIQDEVTTTTRFRAQNITFVGDGTKAVSLWVKEGTSPVNDILLLDVTGATVSRARIRVTWTTGVPSAVAVSGVGSVLSLEPWTDGWWRLAFAAPGVVAAGTNRIEIRPCPLAAADTGWLFAFGVQAEDAPVSSSYIRTTGATASRGADVLSFPFEAKPRELTVYTRFFELGTSRVSASRVWQIGAADDSGPRLNVVGAAGAGYRMQHTSAGGVATVSSAAATAPTLGQLVELRAVLRYNGAVQIGQTLNEGTEEVGAQSGALALPAEWTAGLIHLNSVGTLQPGRMALTHFAAVLGVQTLDQMRTLAGVS